jgi:hypothetical protein
VATASRCTAPIPADPDALPVRDRAGWRSGGIFYVSTSAWREIHKGADPNRAAVALQEAGYLTRGEGKNLAVRLPREVQGRPRAYQVAAEILRAGDD